jgi:hypothetical protein
MMSVVDLESRGAEHTICLDSRLAFNLFGTSLTDRQCKKLNRHARGDLGFTVA